MPVSRHGLPFWCSPCRQMRVSRHRLLFGGPPCRQMLVPRHRRRPAVMVGGYGAPLWWALCNGPPRGGRCLVTSRAVAFWPECVFFSCFSTAFLQPRRRQIACWVSSSCRRDTYLWQNGLSLVRVDVKSRAGCVPIVNTRQRSVFGGGERWFRQQAEGLDASPFGELAVGPSGGGHNSRPPPVRIPARADEKYGYGQESRRKPARAPAKHRSGQGNARKRDSKKKKHVHGQGNG